MLNSAPLPLFEYMVYKGADPLKIKRIFTLYMFSFFVYNLMQFVVIIGSDYFSSTGEKKNPLMQLLMFLFFV